MFPKYPNKISFLALTIFLAVSGILLVTIKEKPECLSCAPDPVLAREQASPVVIQPVVKAPETVEQIIERVGKEEGLSSYEIERFKKIAWCESRNDPNAVSRTNDFGLLQINATYWKFDMSKIFDAEYNTRYAMSVVYPAQGFSAWYCNSLTR